MSVLPELQPKTKNEHRPIACLFNDERPSPLHRRLLQRFHPYWISCDRGLIVDISADGLRLLTRRRLHGFVELRLWRDKLGVQHKAEVVWSRRTGIWQWENGLQFVNYGPEISRALSEIAAHPHLPT